MDKNIKCSKPKFDPKTLRPFDKIIVRGSCIDSWGCTLFSHFINTDYGLNFFTTSSCFVKYCIPYNEETKHLVGTSDEAPEQYKYWED